MVDPHFFAEFASDVRETLFAVETEGFETPVAEHFYYLGVFCGGRISVRVLEVGDGVVKGGRGRG